MAFLRGINVGKINRVKMEDLRAMCESLGLEGVRTHLQTGNVIFESHQTDLEALAAQLEAGMQTLGCSTHVPVMIRTQAQMLELARLNPFQAPTANQLQYLVLTRQPSALGLPLKNPKGDLAVLAQNGLDVFIQGERIEKGNFPNAFVETKLKVAATTRFWNVVQDVMAKLEHG